MEAVYFYLVFAVSGALTSMVSIWYPAHQVAKALDPTNISVGMPKFPVQRRRMLMGPCQRNWPPTMQEK